MNKTTPCPECRVPLSQHGTACGWENAKGNVSAAQSGDWVKRYSELRETMNMTDSINQLVKEVHATAPVMQQGEGSWKELKDFVSDQIMRRNNKDATDNIIAAFQRVTLPTPASDGVEWVSVESGNLLPDYDEPVLWHREDGAIFYESLDKDENFKSFLQKFQYTLNGATAQITHWGRVAPPQTQSKDR